MVINPLPLQTGSTFIYPGPRTHDGLLYESQDSQESAMTLELINRMIGDLDKLNKSGEDCPPPESLAETWSEDMIWYGPAGIGASYTIRRYQEQHQYPFRKGLKDKVFNGHICRLAADHYAAIFGWTHLSTTPVVRFLCLTERGLLAAITIDHFFARRGAEFTENW